MYSVGWGGWGGVDVVWWEFWGWFEVVWGGLGGIVVVVEVQLVARKGS